jgi:hypothetical protein
MPESIIESHAALLEALQHLYRSTERLNDCLGAVVAAQQGRLAEDLINPETFLRDIAQIGHGEAVHHLDLLNALCERLHIDPMAMSQIPDPQQQIKIQYH